MSPTTENSEKESYSNQEALMDLSRELHQTRAEVSRLLRINTSVSARVWEFLSKLSVAAVVGIVGWNWRLSEVAADHQTRLTVIEGSFVSEKEAADLKADILSRRDPQVDTLMSEMRAFMNVMTERLARLEAKMEAHPK